jgi:ATP-dependent Clp protease ATP-binding subunit ClpA
LFERYTDRAHRVIVIAQDEANLLGHSDIGSAHLLLGLISEGEGVAGQALKGLGVTLEAARERLGPRIISRVAEEPRRPPQFKPGAKKVLERALREALQLGHNYVGTEHILLALAREGDLLGASVLEIIGVSTAGVRARVLDLLRGYAEAERAVPLQDCRWRAGGRTIHAQRGAKAADGDLLIGMMDTAELAAEAVAAHNWALISRLALRKTAAAPLGNDDGPPENAPGEARGTLAT